MKAARLIKAGEKEIKLISTKPWGKRKCIQKKLLDTPYESNIY